MSSKMTIYLASESPRRRMLLAKAGITFQEVSPIMEEGIKPGEEPEIYAKRMAIEKAKSVLPKIKDGLIIAADTIVVKDREILGKPQDAQDAIRMLRKLSGTDHHVYTAIAILDRRSNRLEIEIEKTKVEMRNLEAQEIQKYVDSGEPLDAAGAYKIQEGAASFVRRIEGCYYNVVGLPLATLIDMLKRFKD